MAMNTNESTLVAAFRNDSEARAAIQELETRGVTRDHIHVHTGSAERRDDSQHESGFMGWVKSLFGEDESSYTNAYRDGHTIVAVDARNDDIDDIANILDRHDPLDLQAHDASAATAGTVPGASPTQDTTDRNRAASKNRQETSAIPVVQEEIAVGKRSYQPGGVKVYSRLVETPVEENVRLRDEHVYVDRKPANRPATASDLKGQGEQVVEVQEFAEEPVIEKRARVVEEVRVGKNVSERTEKVRDSVRRTEVDVEPTAGKGGTEIDDTDFRRHFQQTYAGSGANYADFGPAYEYGYTSASDPRYRNRSFNEIEPELRSSYERRNPNSTWEKVKDSVRYGWDRVTGKA